MVGNGVIFSTIFVYWAMIVVFWIGIIVLVIWAVAKLIRSGKSVSSNSAIDIVKERYAKGEITKEEYEQIKKDIG
ncbi:MAG: SHOCT domain-containing protein [Dehalococcoidales bacterium]